MSDFEPLNPNEPATIENVLMAVMRLRAYDEATLAKLISQAGLTDIFPFRPRPVELPPDKLDETDVQEASPHPMTESRYLELVKASIHSDGLSPAAVSATLAKGVAWVETHPAMVTKTARKARKTGLKIRPLRDRIIVKRVDEQQTTDYHVTLADKPNQGFVVAIGGSKIMRTDDKAPPMDVKVGDRILFGKYSGETVKVKGDELLAIRKDEIIGVIASTKK